MKEPLETVTGAGHRLGEYIRDQRRTSQISLRQLSALAGVSNPYLSQIERGLRKPSAEILQQIAKALRISAEAMYVQAGILEQREGNGVVADAIHSDDGINERQKQVLLEIYESFRRENAGAVTAEPPPPSGEPQPAPRKRAALTATPAEPDGTGGTGTTAGPGKPRRSAKPRHAAKPRDVAQARDAAKNGTTGTRTTPQTEGTDPTEPQEARS